MQKHYHALYKAQKRAIEFIRSEGYTNIISNLKEKDFQIIASNGKNTRYVRLVIAPKGKLNTYILILDQLRKISLPQASSKELWVWEIRTGWHFYPVNEN